MRIATGYEDRKARIEIVPLIDVVFNLIVFFIYAMLSMTVYHGLRLNLPVGSGAVERVQSVLVSIDRDNTLWVEGRAASVSEVVEHVAGLVKAGRSPVLVQGDRNADLGAAIELLSALRKANVEAVSFQIRRQE